VDVQPERPSPLTRPLRILVVGSGFVGSLEQIYVRAFRSLPDVAVSVFDLDAHRIRSRRLLLNRVINNRVTFPLHGLRQEAALVRHLVTCRGAYDLIVLFKGMEFRAKTLHRLRGTQPGAVWVNINPDDPFNDSSVASTNANVVASAPFFDAYFIWSHRVAERLRVAGCGNVHYLPFGYDPLLHSPALFSTPPLQDLVTFVGAWDPEREAILNNLGGINLKVYGTGWTRVSARSHLRDKITPVAVFGEELARIVARSSISLNLLRTQNAGSHNMRTFEIPAMGGLMLTTRSREQHDFFPEGEGCFMFGTPADLGASIRHILERPEAAARVRLAGSRMALQHSYSSRAAAVLKEALRCRR
jgi:spore maturation protein CgeB